MPGAAVPTREMIEAGMVAPVIDRGFDLSEAAAAIRYLETEQCGRRW